MKKIIILLTIFISLISFSKTYDFFTLQNPPLEYLENSSQKGIVIDVLDEISKRMGEEFTYNFLPWARAINYLKMGKTDGIFNAANTAERRQWANYHEEVLIYEKYVIFVKKGSNITLEKDLSDASQHTLGALFGYSYGEFDKDLKKFKKIERSQSTTASLKKLISGRIDMFLGDIFPTIYYAKREGLLDSIEIVQDENFNNLIVSVAPTYLAFAKKRVQKKFIERFNETLKEIKKDGTYDKILSSYYK